MDAVFLNEAPPLLRFEISRDGIILKEREEGLWTDFIGRALARLSDAEAILTQPAEEFPADIKKQDLALLSLPGDPRDYRSRFPLGGRREWGSPDDAGSTFLVLADRRVIDRELAERMRDAVGLRNLIAHGYSLADRARIHQEYEAGISNLRRFLAAVASKAGL